MQTQHTQAKMLFEDDDTAIIGLYGVVFGGEDLEGESFSKSTDFKLNRAIGAPVHIDHTAESYIKFNDQTYMLKGIKDEIGEILEVSPDDIGLYMKLQFEKSNEYWGLVEAMYNTGRMGASTGSDHRAQKSASGLIEIWPINEVSLTLTPAEPRTTENVQRLKSEGVQVGESFFVGTNTTNIGEIDKPITYKADNLPPGLEINIKDGSLVIKSNELTDSEQSAEEAPEAQESAVVQSDTSETDITEAAEISAIEKTEPEAPEVSEMETETVEAKGFDFEKAFAGITESIGSVKSVLDAQSARIEELEKQPSSQIKAANAVENAKSVSFNEFGLGDSETQHIKAWATGRAGERLELKASNPTDMNIGTPADGGNITTTGFYNQIIMRRDETDLTTRLPLMRIPGVNNTEDIPTFDEDDGELVTTAEAAAYDEDAPALGKKQSTLSWKTKIVKVSNQLLQSAAIQGGVEDLLSRFIGMGVAKTRNEMLVTEVLANGTANTAFAGASTIAFGEPESILKNNNLAPYLDSENAIMWLMSNNTLWTIRSIVGQDRQYYANQNDDRLLGYGVATSQKMPTLAANAKSMVIGNWNYMAYREAPSLTLIRDQYTLAGNGQIRIVAHFAAAFTVTQSEAFVYGVQAAS